MLRQHKTRGREHTFIIQKWNSSTPDQEEYEYIHYS
jgi:hypothetical protein